MTASGKTRRLDHGFFAGPAADVAEAMLGTHLCVRDEAAVRRSRIVETEAYVGPPDLACHASKGRTARTEVMFGSPGRTYVYFIYGMHHMLNVVTGAEGQPAAVLVRAAEPVAGVDGRLDGPGRLTRTLGITVQGDNGIDLAGDRIWLEAGPTPERVERTPRIGIDYAGEWATAPLRFVDAESDHLSIPLSRRL